jgi:hypothetical protein
LYSSCDSEPSETGLGEETTKDVVVVRETALEYTNMLPPV